MKLRNDIILFWLIVSFFLVGCSNKIIAEPKQSPVSRIIERNYIECFEKGLKTSAGKLVHCETSAIVYTKYGVVFGNDKPLPDKFHSPVFSMKFGEKGFGKASFKYLTSPPLMNAIKYEDFTLTPDGKYIIATTGFDRVKSESNEWDPYNTLLFWPVDDAQNVKIISKSTTDDVASSVSLRPKLSSALKTNRYPQGMQYFKVEGLAAIPGDILLFGIREAGPKYNDFEYVVKLISVSYTIVNDELVLANDFRLIYDYNPATKFELTHKVALSSIEYDRHSDRLYLLTSFEESKTDEGLGGFLWTLPIADLETQCAPTLVMKNTSDPLLFAHKAEGVTVLDADRILVIHDDDRVLGRERIENTETQFNRQANQAAYTIIEFVQ